MEVSTLNELKYYLMVSPCPLCDKGRRLLRRVNAPNRPGGSYLVETICEQCSAEGQLHVTCRTAPGQLPDDPECINPTDRHSDVIDLAQWLSLFYLLIESAAAETAKPEVKLRGYRAALCLAEALKFYGPDDLPGDGAFFSSTTVQLYRQHPERFSKSRLLAMQAKLPPATLMRRHLARYEGHKRKQWWRFWQK